MQHLSDDNVSSLFSITKVEHGTGWVSNQSIGQGNVIFDEAPLVHVPSSSNMLWELTCKILVSGKHHVISSLYSKRVSNSPIVTKAMLKPLIQNYSKKIILQTYQIVCRNAYTIKNFVTFHDRGLGLYPLISRLNHHCDPNCVLVFEDCVARVVSIRDIVLGEELTVSYHLLASACLPLSFRQKVMMKHYDFVCDCSHCKNYDILFQSDDTKILEALEKSSLDYRMINLSRVIKSQTPIILLVTAILCLRCFLDSGWDLSDAVICNDVVVQSLETIHEIPMSYLRWYGEYIFTLVLKIQHSSHAFNNLLIKNDIVDCPLLNI